MLVAADGSDQPPAILELLQQRRRDLAPRRRRDYDRVERARLGPAAITITMAHVHVGTIREALLCALGQGLDDLDCQPCAPHRSRQGASAAGRLRLAERL